MRRGNGGGIIRTEDDALLAVTLGADFTAEHEWGIEEIRQLYGIDDSAEGIERRKIRLSPEKNIVVGDVKITSRDYSKPRAKPTATTWWGLVSDCYPFRHDVVLDERMAQRCELYPYGDVELCGSWDGGSFGFLVKDKTIVDEIHAAILNCDLCIGLFNGQSWNPFSRSGLGLLIASRVPQSVRDNWLETDRDQRRLKEAALATGIAKRLADAKIQYFALSPRWSDDTKKDVVFWLNPYDQHCNNSGWYTVKDLDQWIHGKGSVPKKESVA